MKYYSTIVKNFDFLITVYVIKFKPGVEKIILNSVRKIIIIKTNLTFLGNALMSIAEVNKEIQCQNSNAVSGFFLSIYSLAFNPLSKNYLQSPDIQIYKLLAQISF